MIEILYVVYIIVALVIVGELINRSIYGSFIKESKFEKLKEELKYASFSHGNSIHWRLGYFASKRKGIFWKWWIHKDNVSQRIFITSNMNKLLDETLKSIPKHKTEEPVKKKEVF